MTKGNEKFQEATDMVKPDEEHERMQRRGSVLMEQNIASLMPKNTASTSFNNELRVCSELFLGNRISAKNAWQLNIIDLIKDAPFTSSAAVSADGGGANKQMQIATQSLDISSKIYSIRVDDVHATCMKLASSISSKEAVVDGSGGEEEEVGGSQELETAAKRKRTQRKAVVKKNTVDKEGTGLRGPLSKIESFEFSTSDDVNVGTVDNLLTLKTPMHPSGHKFLRKEKYATNGRDEALTEDPLKLPLDLPNVKNAQICSAFGDFDLLQWDPNESSGAAGDSESALVDAEGLPIHELEGSIHDIFENQNDFADEPASDDDDDDEQLQVQLYGELPQIVDRVPEKDLFPTEYNYNALFRTSTGKVIDKIWAGPSHWQVKFIKRAAEKYSGNVQRPQVKTARKRIKTKEEFGPVKFDMNFPGLDHDDVARKSKRSYINVDPEKITLPIPSLRLIDYKLHRFSKFIHKGRETDGAGAAEVLDISGYNYDNLNDSLYCPPLDDGGSEDGEENAAAQQPGNFLTNNLVDMPESVAKSTVPPYALKAKRIDMKKLKAAIWENLTVDDGRVPNTTFKRMYEKLPTHLSADLKSELTCPLAFVAFLHLCNEQNLKCTSNSPTFDDFVIEKVDRYRPNLP